MQKYIEIIKQYSRDNYTKITREPSGVLNFPFIVPGAAYSDDLWDWDSWLTDIAIRQIMVDNNIENNFIDYEIGCILNFLDHTDDKGRMPIIIRSKEGIMWMKEGTNMHKPCLAQHIAFILEQNKCDADWLTSKFDKLEKFIGNYYKNQRDEKTGLFFWLDDLAIGVDNDPTTFYKPQKSSASIYLNCMMYKELCAMDYICKKMNLQTKFYSNAAQELKNAINEQLWDERNGFYYSADLNLLPIEKEKWLHSGMPRHWDCLIQKIDTWCGFMCLWAGIASEDRAERIVKENLLNDKLFYSDYGIRSLSKSEKMYRTIVSSNPSCWTGPIWGIANYMCFRGLIKYGYADEARELAKRTVVMFGKDIEAHGEMHEYYNPETGNGVHNIGFQSWNLLVNNMIAWFENGNAVCEF